MGVAIERLDVQACRVPTEVPETDGTAAWDATTIVIVQARTDGVTGLGYSYIDAAAAGIVERVLAPCVTAPVRTPTRAACRAGAATIVPGAPAIPIREIADRMGAAVRNHGKAGVCACAIAAVDVALWDLQARLVGLPLAELLGAARHEVPVYASGGFTSTPLDALAREVAEYEEAGHTRVKIKIGRDHPLERVRVAREAAPSVELMVDGNGAFERKEALRLAHELAALGVRYFEEPVSMDDRAGLRLLRDAAPLQIAAGEYAYEPADVLALADCVDILQADATRCLGITGFLAADAIAGACRLPLSSHCAPALHAHVDAAATRLVHLEDFRDHVRLEAMLFDGAPRSRGGVIKPTGPGLGLTLRDREARRHAA